MGSLVEVCTGSCNEKIHEFTLMQSSHNNSFLNKNIQQDLNSKNLHKNSVSNEVNINTNNGIIKNNFNTENFKRNENDLIKSIDQMTQIIESLENKNKLLEKEKNEIKEENEKLLKELEICKNKSKIRNLRKNSIASNESSNAQNLHNSNKANMIKLIFIFNNSKDINNNNKNENESKEELFAYEDEIFIEVKLRLLKLKKFGPRDIKKCYYNSKEINNWYTLEELNIKDNSTIICDIT